MKAMSEAPFDAEAARATVARMVDEGAPALFASAATDSQSEALPAILDNRADITDKAVPLEAMAHRLAANTIFRETCAPG